MEEWSKERLFLLAGNVEKYPCLWRRSDPDYKKRPQRQHALKCIAQTLNCTLDQVDRKVRIILGQFSREVKKENFSNSNSCERKYKSKWFLYPALEFLKGTSHFLDLDCTEKIDDAVNAVIVSVDGSENQGIEEENGENSNNCERNSNGENLNLFENFMREDEKYDYFDNNGAIDDFHAVEYRKRPSNHQKLIHVGRNFSNSQEEPDECDLFGSFVSKKMKKLNEINRSIVQMEISQIIFRKEMEQRGLVVSESNAVISKNYCFGFWSPKE